MVMYFRNKFNLEVQRIIRNMDEFGAGARVNHLVSNLWRVETIDKKTIKIIPLVMYESLSSTNKEDKVYDNRIVVAENKGGTVIYAGGTRK